MSAEFGLPPFLFCAEPFGHVVGGRRVISDAAMVGLVRESVMAGSPVRQIAARIMLALARRDGGLPVSPERLEVIRADSGSEVAQEVTWLSDHLGIASDAS